MAVQNIAGPGASLDYRIRFAIAHKRLIELKYKRVARLAEPHDYGRQGGVDRLLIYQLRGPARPGHSPIGWRLFDFSSIESLEVLEQTFRGSRHASNQRHHGWDVLYARVE